MELREFAAREVSALVDRLASHADGLSQDQLTCVHKEHEDAIGELRQKMEAQARELAERTQKEHDAAITGLREKLETQARELAERTQSEARLAATAVESRTQVESLRFELDVQRIALEQQRAEAERQRAEAERQTAAAAEQQRAEAERQTAAAADRASLEHELREAEAALEAAKADVVQRTRQFESTLEEMRAEYGNTIREQALARMALPLDELLAVYRALSSATTPHGVLKTIVAGLAKEFARVALFRVRGSVLECVSHAGFEFEGHVTKVVIPTGIDSLLTRALSSRRIQSFLAQNGDEALPGAPFGGTPSCVLALPIVLGDAAVAVIYADDSDQLEFASVPAPLLVKFAELVWQHATLVLQRATAAKKALAIAPPHTFDRPA